MDKLLVYIAGPLFNTHERWYLGQLAQALEEIGTEKIDEVTEMKILELLKKEEPKNLKHDLTLAPAKVHDYIIKLLKREENDRVAKIK